MTAKGHNSELTEGERKALFFHHLQKELAIKAKLDELKTERKSLRKTAQADGIVLADMDFAVKAMEMEDKQLVVDGVKSKCEVLSWLNYTSGYQPDLFTDRAPAFERIEAEGELAGLAGKTGISPYEAKSQEDEAWLRGWGKGQKQLADNFLSAREKLDATSSDDDDFSDDPFPDDADIETPTIQ